jgi:hypothetical protein
MTQQTFPAAETLGDKAPPIEQDDVLADEKAEEGSTEQATEDAPEQSVGELKAALEVSNSTREKVERDLKAISRGRERQSARDERIIALINTNQEANVKAMKALAEAFANPEGVEDAIGSIETERLTASAQTAFESRYQRLWDTLMESTRDEEGNEVFNIRDSKYAEFQNDWVKAQKSGDLAELAVLVGRASGFRITAEREKTQASTSANGNRKSGRNLDLDTGNKGSAAFSDQALVDAFGDSNQILTKEETQKAMQLMDKGMFPRLTSQRR